MHKLTVTSYLIFHLKIEWFDWLKTWLNDGFDGWMDGWLDGWIDWLIDYLYVGSCGRCRAGIATTILQITRRSRTLFSAICRFGVGAGTSTWPLPSPTWHWAGTPGIPLTPGSVDCELKIFLCWYHHITYTDNCICFICNYKCLISFTLYGSRDPGMAKKDLCVIYIISRPILI